MNKTPQKPLTQQEKVVVETAVKTIVKKYHETLSKLSKT